MGKNDEDEKSSSYVFVLDPDFGWRPAVMEDQDGHIAICSVPEYKNEEAMTCDGGRAAKSGEQVEIDLRQYPHQVLPLQNVDSNGNLLVFPDMVKLPYLHEAAILYNLKARHMQGHPYTRTGDIVIAVNPFQWFLDLYTEEKRRYYSNKLVWEESEQDPRENMAPHVYEVSSLSYKGLAFGRVDQSILVSGESGAGKTETVKICMNHMASVQRGPMKSDLLNPEDDKNELDPVVKRVVESNPLLEAFGNASTRRNDNSSRFGKYLQLQFDSSGSTGGGGPMGGNASNTKCVLAGSKSEVYLLEKNRVTMHDTMERTYHIFYQILAAPDDQKCPFWSKLKGTDYDSFKYIGTPPLTKIEGMTDAQHFEHTCNTLRMIKVDGDKLKALMQAIIIVMQCGNLTFGAKGGDKDKSEIVSKKEADDLAELMGVSAEDLALCFTERTMKTKTETYKVPLNQDFAKDSADAFAKEVYGKLFLWLVKNVNDATCAEDNYKEGSMSDFGVIGLLDIFGFESFVTNRFEQLCINYANEKLQQKFTEDVFQAVQAEYEAEGIELAEITYDDNTDVLDLIESRTGLLAMLNEECVRPKGNDQAFVQKALSANKKSACLIVNSYDRMSFGIHHYAGKVMYDADGFVGSNQDTMPTDLEDLGRMSTNDIVSKPAVKIGDDPPAAAAPKRAAPKRQKSNLVAPTAWAKYKTQLTSLMTSLRKTNSRYIRCVKPNMKKVPNIMEHIPTMEQLRCAGVVAAVTLARSAFPNRLENESVRFRYGGMWDRDEYPSSKTDSMTKEEVQRCDCDAILACALKTKEYTDDDGRTHKAYVCGKTKSYFRAGALEYLEANRSAGLDAQAKTIQRIGRGYIVRKQFASLVADKNKAEREAQEKAEREEAERLAKLEAEKAEREAKRSGAKKEVEDKMTTIKKEIKEADEYGESHLEELRQKKEEIEQEIEDLKEKTGPDAKKALKEPKKIMAVQKKKLEEQKRMVDHLKKENKKIRKEHEKIKKKFDVVKENNDKLVRASENTGDDFDMLNEQSRRVNEKNENLMQGLENAKQDNKRLKEECMAKQDEYMTQAETRLEYQKTMARILNMIQEASKEPCIVEDTVCIALECEAEAKSIMAELEAETE